MKTIVKKWFILMNLMTVIVCVLTGCAGAEETVNFDSEETPAYRLGVDTEENMYKLALCNMRSGAMVLVMMNDDDKVERMDIVSNLHKKEMIVGFDDKGRVCDISIDSVTLVIDNYKDGKADFAYLYKDYVYMSKGVDFEPVCPDISTKASVGNTDQIHTKNLALDADRWLIEHQKEIRVFFLAVNQALDYGKIYAAGIKDSPKEVGAAFGELGKDVVLDGLGTLDKDNQWLDLIDHADSATDIFYQLKNGKVMWVYSALEYLMTNYSDYSEFCENAWYKLFELQESWRQSNIETGSGILQSGSGALKVTLNWNFYADIDLEAIEPSGEVIDYQNKRSSSGGYLDMDNRNGGSGAVENIYWEKVTEGRYRIILHHYGYSMQNDLCQSGVCKVSVLYNGVGRTFNVPMSRNDYETVVVLTMPEGKMSEVSSGSKAVRAVSYVRKK